MRHMDLDDIVGASGYRIYENGRVVSFLSGAEKDLSIHIAATGYPSVGMKRGGKSVCFNIHRLLGVAFIPNPMRKPQLNHINGVKTDNRISNLEWCTDSENKFHAHRNGLVRYTEKKLLASRMASRKMILARRSLSDKKVDEVRRHILGGASVSKAARLSGVSRSIVASISCGRAYAKSRKGLLREIRQIQSQLTEMYPEHQEEAA